MGSWGVGAEGKGKLKASLPSETCLLRLRGNLTSQQTVQKSFPKVFQVTQS